MFNAPLPIFEDEDEEQLIADFVRLSATHPNHDAYSVCRHIFKELRDPELRSAQAAKEWSNDIGIIERIREYRLNGPPRPTLTKQALQEKILSVTEDLTMSDRDKRAMIEGYMAIARLNAWEVKAVNQTNTDATPRFSQIIGAVYDD